MPSREQEQFAGLSGIDEEDAAGPLDIRRLRVTDGDTERSGEGFTNNGDRVGGDGGFVHAREKLVLGLVCDDVNVFDLVFLEDRSAMDDDPEAEFGGERVAVDANHYDGGRGGLTGYAETEGMHKRTPHLLLEQVRLHGRTDDILPDAIKTVRTENRELLRLEIGLGARRLHPDVSTGACDHASLGRETIEIVFGLDWRRDVRSIGRWGRNAVARHANGSTGNEKGRVSI